MEALLGSHREPSYTSRVSRLLGMDGESVFLSSISDSFSDAERTLKILGHFTPILAEYVVTMRQVNALREAHGDDDEAYRKARDDVLDAQHERAGPRVGAMYDDLGSVYLKTAQFAAAQGSLLPAAFERHLQFAFENARNGAGKGCEIPSVPRRIRAAASDCIARERGKLDADPERYFRGLLDGPRLRARLFRLATSDDLHLWALPKADALLRAAATCLADDATARRAALAAATAAAAGGAALAGLAFFLLLT